MRVLLMILIVQTVLFMQPNRINSELCEFLSPNNLQLIRDYTKWRNITSLIIFKDNLSNCNKRSFKTFMKYFSPDYRFILPHPSIRLLENFIGRMIIIHLLSDDNQLNSSHIINEMDKLQKRFMEKLSWFIIGFNKSTIIEKLKVSTFGVDADIVIAIKTSLIEQNRWSKYKENVTSQSNLSSKADSTTNFKTTKLQNNFMVELIQIYKIRKELQDSIIFNSLGHWSLENNTTKLHNFLSIEQRTNFNNYSIIFGKTNSSSSSSSMEVLAEEEENMDEFLKYFTSFFNASERISYFQKLGFKDSDGQWNDLLQAVVNEEIDMGLHNVIKTPDKYNDMAFTHEIMESMRNIYIKPQESNEFRDIFLIPFNKKLILCVIVTAIIFGILMAITNSVEQSLFNNSKNKNNQKIEIADTIIWCIGIFCMQGSYWQPAYISGSLILILALMFALLIYSSYSAFITSVLSVGSPKIKSIADLLESDYAIGYTKQSSDEILLRSMNDSQLQQIYLRGYLGNTVSSIEEGLLKSTKGRYGFFASCNIARKELEKINNFRCNYNILEIPVYKTRYTVAFPLSKSSPYRKLINLSLLKMYQTGIYKYIHKSIIPALPICKKTKVFRSAQLSDLISAFGILVIGLSISLVLLIIEYIMHKKKNKLLHIKNLIGSKKLQLK